VILRKNGVRSLRLPSDTKVDRQIRPDLPAILGKKAICVLPCVLRLESVFLICAVGGQVCSCRILCYAAYKHCIQSTSFGQLSRRSIRYSPGSSAGEFAECRIGRIESEADRWNDPPDRILNKFDPFVLTAKLNAVTAHQPCERVIKSVGRRITIAIRVPCSSGRNGYSPKRGPAYEQVISTLISIIRFGYSLAKEGLPGRDRVSAVIDQALREG